MNNFDMQQSLINAGNVELTDEQKNILFAPIDETQISIKPTGIVYLSWSFYATRLRLAFGMQWAIIPNGMPVMQNNLVIWGFYLFVKGSLMGYAIGEQNYIPTNKEMSYTDACEGAKSNALMRLCKEIGIGLELWQQEYVRAWKNKFATTYQEYDENKKKDVTRWKKIQKLNTNNIQFEDIKKELNNKNIITQKFGKTSNKDKLLESARKIFMIIKKQDVNKFKEESDYYLSIKNSSLDITDIEYEVELDKLMKLELKIKELNTGSITNNDPDNIEFHINEVKDKLPLGVI